ncbi:serine hydrolase domain-containing protein [Novosphingobium sp. BL-8A]|uniref:serine hydrolase domain-containing protein n=1 Tax=Novosphingobium sp. BL-8A TaxID=3127639 RepID=UPI0037564DBE
MRTYDLMGRRDVLGAVGAGLALSILPRAARAADGLDDLIRQQMAAAQIPGLALGVVRDGQVRFARGYGLADIGRGWRVTPETMFHIASITKAVIASATMLLVEEGKVALDEPVAPHLDFEIAGENAAAITVRQLLMHTSGISDEVYYQTDFRSLGTDTRMPLDTLLREYLAPGGRYTGAGNVKRVPGSNWDYSNIGFALLGYLGGRIAGMDMRAFIRERLFAPLGLRHIAWTIAETPERLRATPYDLDGTVPKPVPTVGFPDWPAGMIRASIGDLALLVAAAANGGGAGHVRLLEVGSNVEMLTIRKPAGLPDWLTGQGLAWQESMLGGVPRINHWGGDPGVFTMAYVDPDRRTGVVLLSNLSATPKSREALKAIATKAFDSFSD